MSLDRQSIEKRDFPISRRGYETVAVDEHLARIAGEVEALQAGSPAAAPTSSLASSASERIRGIVEAAETTAAEIERAAQQEAEAARAAAADDARALREGASAEAQAHVAAVQEATATMLSRVGALESEVAGLLEHLRDSATSVGADLATLQAQVAEVGGLGSGGPQAPVAAPAAPAPSPAPAVSAGVTVDPTPVEPAATQAPEPVSTPAPTGAAFTPAAGAPVPAAPDAPELALSDGPPAERSTDVAGARMVALNLVLDGVPREQIEAHLDERYTLEDRAGLLDDLYAKQG
jgi:hypothetical protein